MTAFRSVEQPHPDYLVQGVAWTIDQPWFSGDAPTPTAPTSATVTIRNAAGTAVVAAQVATITSSVMTYAIDAATFDGETVGAHWQIEWTPVYSGVTYPPIVRRASLCLRDLPCPISTRSVQLGHPELISYPTGQSSWSPQIEEAHTWVLQQIERTGRRPELVVGADTLYEVEVYKARGVIFRLLAAMLGGDKYMAIADYYDHMPQTTGPDDPGGLAQRAWSAWRADYDTDGSGQVGADESGALLYPAGRAW